MDFIRFHPDFDSRSTNLACSILVEYQLGHVSVNKPALCIAKNGFESLLSCGCHCNEPKMEI